MPIAKRSFRSDFGMFAQKFALKRLTLVGQNQDPEIKEENQTVPGSCVSHDYRKR